VNTQTGIVTDAPNLPGWNDVPLARVVSEQTGRPTLLENDAAAACYGEFRFGAGQGFRHIVYVTLGTGIGGGIIIDGKLYGGASGAAGEVGHITVDAHGPPCNCGGRGCVETLASGRAIERDAAAALEAGRAPGLARLASGEITGELVHQAASEGDEDARAIIERAGYYLGLGLVALLNCFNPEALILGGGLIRMGELYLGPAKRVATELAFEQVVADATLTEAALSDSAGALGAAALVMDRLAG
jgi:glucokinase